MLRTCGYLLESITDSLASKRARRLIGLGLLVPCLLVCIPALFAFRAQRQLHESLRWVEHTIEVQNQLQGLLSSVLSAETGQRGYLLTSRELYLEPYTTARSSLPRQFAALRKLTADNPVQLENLHELEGLTSVRLEIMAETMARQKRGDHEGALDLINSDRGQQSMEAIRARLRMMDDEESHLLTTRQQLLTSRSRFSALFLVGLIGLNLLFAGTVFVLLRRLLKVRNLVTVCAWSRTVEYEGEWLSFEEYLQRRFGLSTSHGISPQEAEKILSVSRTSSASPSVK